MSKQNLIVICQFPEYIAVDLTSQIIQIGNKSYLPETAMKVAAAITKAVEYLDNDEGINVKDDGLTNRV